MFDIHHVGADDIQQLKELEDEEIEQLCIMIGMDKKPFHIMRLRKTLMKHSSLPKPSDARVAHHVSVSVSQPPLNRASSQSQESQRVRQETMTFASNSEPGPSKAFLDAMNGKPYTSDTSSTSTVAQHTTTLGSAKASTRTGNKKFFFLPPYLQSSSECKTFDELVDDQTPVQKMLGPAPFSPSTWDPERAELIRKYSSIYGKNFDKRQKEMLTPFEQHVNEAACQLCLRDPTLLVRREELFVLSKRAVKEGGYTYYHGFSKSKNVLPVVGQKRPRDPDELSEVHPPQITTLTFAYNIPNKLSSKMRKEHMAELEKLIAENRTQQSVKLVALEKAQQLCDFSTAYSIQLEVETLGMHCEQLQSTYNTIKRRQHRSERYFRAKQKENPESKETNSSLSGDDSDTPHTSKSGASNTLHSSPQVVTNSAGSSSEQVPLLHQRHSFVDLEKDRAPIFPHYLPHRSPNAEMNSKISTVTATVIPNSKNQDSQTHTVTVTVPQNPTSETGVRDLVNNVNHATDEVNSIMIHELQKQLNW